MLVEVFFSGEGRSSIGDRQEDLGVRVVHGQEWVVGQEGRRVYGGQCIRREVRRADREDRGSVQGWERVQDLGRGRLERVREWVARRDWHRLRVRHRVRRVRDREAAEDRGMRRPKKDR
jgi:hypothetical protein